MSDSLIYMIIVFTSFYSCYYFIIIDIINLNDSK